MKIMPESLEIKGLSGIFVLLLYHICTIFAIIPNTVLFSLLVKELAEKEGVTEKLKAENQMLWVQKMNNIRNRATKIVNAELIYSI